MLKFEFYFALPGYIPCSKIPGEAQAWVPGLARLLPLMLFGLITHAYGRVSGPCICSTNLELGWDFGNLIYPYFQNFNSFFGTTYQRVGGGLRNMCGLNNGPPKDVCPNPQNLWIYYLTEYIKITRNWRLKKTEFILSQFWRSEVQNQSVGRVIPFGGLTGRICSMFSSCLLVVDDRTSHTLLWLIDTSLQSLPLLPYGVLVCHFCLCVFMWYSLYASVSKFPLLYTVTSNRISLLSLLTWLYL